MPSNPPRPPENQLSLRDYREHWLMLFVLLNAVGGRSQLWAEAEASSGMDRYMAYFGLELEKSEETDAK